MKELIFTDLFVANEDGTFTNKVKLKIGMSHIYNIRISKMFLPQFNISLEKTKESIFNVNVDSKGFYQIVDVI